MTVLPIAARPAALNELADENQAGQHAAEMRGIGDVTSHQRCQP